MTKKEFLHTIQSRTARVSIAASAARGKGNKGAVKASRAFLCRLDLTAFGTKNRSIFVDQLNRTTARLRAALPPKARRWGLARKFLNIFLRDCLYTTYLSEAYCLERAERFLEVPLDSITARELRRAAGRGNLPKWPGVKGVTPKLSARYQAVATEAAERGIARVHLDAKYWSLSRD